MKCIDLFAPDVIFEIITLNRLISSIEVFSPSFPPLLQKRAHLTDIDREIIDSVLESRIGSQLPFWDATMLKLIKEGIASQGIIQAAAYHNPSLSQLRKINRSELSIERMRDIARSDISTNMIAISSLVQCFDNKDRHIPQIDFHIKNAPGALDIVISVIRQIGIPGFILHSGKSFHFYGRTLLDSNDFAKFLGKALLFSPIVDRSWIAHQLIEGKSALRISGRDGYGGAPRCVAEVDV